MTMPIERARSLRWGWEFLWEIQAATNLTPDQMGRVQEILRHYPSTSDIEDWARALEDVEFPFTEVTGGQWIEAENHQRDLTAPQEGVPLRVDRGPTTAQERLQALVMASELFKQLRIAANLTEEQKRDLVYVLRHFPELWDLTYRRQLLKE